MAEPRLALVEQHLVAVQGKLNHYEEQQQRLLNGIEQIVADLVDKASKARGGRGTEVLQTVNALSNIFSNALLRLEQEIDKRLALVPIGSQQQGSTELEPRLVLLEERLASQIPQPAQADLSPIKEELEHVKEIFVKELGRIHQTTFKAGDLGTPLNQLQQKVSLLETELKILKRADTTQLAEATVSVAITNFRKELEESLGKMVSAEQLHKYKDELKRIEETSLDAQTRSYTLLSRSDHIEAYSKSLLAQFKSAAARLEQELSEEYSRLDNRLQAHFIQLCKKELDAQAEELKMTLIERAKLHFQEVEQYLSKLYSEYVQQEINTIRQRIEDPYKQHLNQYLTMLKSLKQTEERLLTSAEDERQYIQQQLQKIDSGLQLMSRKTRLELLDQVKQFHTTLNQQHQHQFIGYQTKIDELVSRQFSYTEVLKHELTRVSQTALQQEQRIKGLESQVARMITSWSSGRSLPVEKRARIGEPTVYHSLSKCFYTAIFTKPGQPADTLPAIMPMEGWDYICFTNIPSLEQRGWMIQHVEMPHASPVISAKQYKWMSHKYLSDYDVVVWMDAYLAPNPAHESMLQQWITDMTIQKYSIGHRAHEIRDCIYDECAAVLKGKRDTPERVKQVQQLLANTQMPRHKGLFDTNLVIRFHKSFLVQQLSEAIYDQLRSVSPRDQLAVTLQYYLHRFTHYGVYPLQLAWEKRGVHVRVPAF